MTPFKIYALRLLTCLLVSGMSLPALGEEGVQPSAEVLGLPDAQPVPSPPQGQQESQAVTQTPEANANPQAPTEATAETAAQPVEGQTAEAQAPNSENPDALRDLTAEEKQERNFRKHDAFLDTYEGIRSKQYVRRAILTSVISATNKVAFEKTYINHLLGFHAIYQKTRFAKYVSGVQGISVGYVTKKGHAAEIGMDFSSINNIFAGYRYFYRPESFLLWPFGGIGVGYDVGLFTFGEGPLEARNYDGRKSMGFFTLGLLVPLVDVAIKAEIRGCAYWTDRFVLTQGIGAILFF